MQAFNDRIDACGLDDITLLGHPFSWSNSTFGNRRIETKIERALANSLYFQEEVNFNGSYLNPRLSDHRPILLTRRLMHSPKIPFRYFNAWVKEEGFCDIVKEAWNVRI